MKRRFWNFNKNVHGDLRNHVKHLSEWYWGSGKHFWQWCYCPVLNKKGFTSFYGTRKELKEFLKE